MKSFLRFLTVILLLFSAFEGKAQWRLIMEMVVTDEGKNLPGAEIKVFKSGKLVETVLTDAKGRADIPLNPNGDYTIEVGGNKNFAKKKIAVSTNNVPAENAKGDIFYPAEVEIFKNIDGLDLAILEKPIGKIFYDPEYGDFGADRKYTKEVQAKLEQLKRDYEVQKIEEEKNLKEREKEYAAAIKIADKAYASEEWEKAEEEDKRAAKLMPIETYPSFQLAELETKLIKIRETNKKYDEAMTKAAAAEKVNQLETAITEYKRASGYKPAENAPKEKISTLQELITNQAKSEQLYLAAIERGDNALKVNDFTTAKTAFEEAAAAKPSETYPKNKIAEINDIIQKREAKKGSYDEAIASADQAVKEKDYQKAKAEYQKASGIFPTETYPKEQITKMDALMADAAKRDQNYIAEIEKGDQAFKANDFDAAKKAYEAAGGIKPEEAYPKTKLAEINNLIAERAAKDKEYQDKISEADKSLAEKKYELAKTAYQAAAALKPRETYPKEKITEIDGVLSQLAAKEENYKKAITKGDQALGNDDFQAAKTAFNEALTLKPDEAYPKDKLAEIETIVLKNQQVEENYKKAIQNGDDALQAKDFENAKKFYKEAIALKETEKYPKDKLAEIDQKLAAAKEVEENYAAAIKEGDAAFSSNEFEKAKLAFTKAKDLKPEEAYPQEQLTKINETLAAAKKVDEDYKTAIKEGDAAIASLNYNQAKTAFEKAANLKSNEAYPKDKIKEIDTLLAEQNKKQEDYKQAIASADRAFDAKEWEKAKTNYETALTIKQEEHPKNRIQEIETTLKEIAEKEKAAAKIEADYQAAISKGDQSLNNEKLEDAIAAFTQAQQLKPEEEYPSKKLAEIKTVQDRLAKEKAEAEELAKKEADYKSLITAADKAFSANDLKDARENYQAALAIKAEEKHPQERIAAINEQLADAAEQDKVYTAAIKSGDDLFNAQKFEEAKQKYNEALSVKSGEKYPKDQLQVIDTKLAELAAKQEEIRLKQEQANADQQKFDAFVSKADEAFAQKKYEDAKTNYESALGVKEASYPAEKLAEIEKILIQLASKEEEAAKAAQQAKIDAEYQGLIAEADQLLNEKNYQDAKKKYQDALAVKNEQYAQQKVDEIDGILAALVKKNEAEKEKANRDNQYMASITQADEMYSSERFEKAKAKYEEALTYKDEQYPKDQLKAVEAALAAKAKRDAKLAQEAKSQTEYIATIQNADKALSNDNFKEALALYQKALNLMPNETYPSNKIDQINSILEREELSDNAQRAIIESKYMESITLADLAIDSKDYVEAREYYKNAKSLKPKEAYPVKMLAKIDELIANEEQAKIDAKLAKERAAQNEMAYQSAIVAADNFYAEKKYNEAENEYRLALSLKPSSEYPQNQMDRIKAIFDEQKAKEANKRAIADAENQFKTHIANADEAFNKNDYQKAKSEYNKALSLKANEQYPKDRIKAINDLLEQERLADLEKRKQADKPIEIQKGPKKTITGDAEAEIEKLYREMKEKKDAEKLLAIQEKERLVKELGEQKREEENNKRQNAIERIEGISISISEQQKMGDDFYMQNYEVVKEKVKDLNAANEELKVNSERNRNNDFEDIYASSDDFRAFHTKRNESISGSKKSVVEGEYDELNTTINSYVKKQESQIEKSNEAYIRKEETIQEWSRKSAESNLNKNTAFVDQKTKELTEAERERVKNAREKIENSNEEYILKEETIQEWSRNMAESSLNKNTAYVDQKTKSITDAEKERIKNSRERIEETQQEVHQKETDLRQFSESRKEHFKENQNQVEEKEKAVQTFTNELTAESEKKRTENYNEDYYQGEKKTRQDSEAANYAQGVTEEIIENTNNSTTIRRIVVEGTQVDIYEKTFYPYGGIFYTKNGNNITQEVWDAESR